jgi:hypothetical protein
MGSQHRLPSMHGGHPPSSMAMVTSTFSPRPASLRPLRASAKPQTHLHTHLHLHLLPFPRLRAGRRGTRLGRAAAGEVPVEVAPPSEPECDNPPRKIPYYRLRPIHFGH